MDETIGVIGLGPMGGNIAGLLLQKQMRVTGFDVNADCMAALDTLGLAPAADAAALAADAGIIITSLPSLAALDDVLTHIISVDKPGQIVIECSTLAPEDKEAAAARLAAAGKILLDAPISATPAMLAKGMASIHISGEKAAYEKCIAVFEGFTASNFFIGETAGLGSKMKILANYLVHVHVTAAAECMT